MAVPVTNFGLVTVSTTYGAGDTTIVLTTGHGARLPATTGGYRYPMTWWDSTNYPHPADDPNVEIVMVTSRSSDTLTVTRAQESTSASTKNTGGGAVYRMSLGTTKAMWESMRVKNMHQGLVLRTDRDADTEARQVEIVDVDYLVMDDGTVFDNSDNSWTAKYADITQSGAGGLDTGAESGGAWYDIYAIATESGTKDLLLHRAKAWSDGASYVSGEDASQDVASSTSNSYVAQGFKLSNSGLLRYVQLKLLAVGSPTGQVRCEIYSDNAGVPGSSLALSERLDLSKIPTTATWIHFNFPWISSEFLSASPTKYHLVISGVVNASNYIQWRMDGSAGTYADGAKATWNGTSWTTDTDDDMMFTVGLEVDDSSVTMPTGYTKKCHLGWVFNDGSSNFRRFIQTGRTRRDLFISETDNYIQTLDATVQIVRLFAPAVESCRAFLACGGTGTQASVVAIGDTSRYDLSSAGDTTSAQAILYSVSTATKPGAFIEIPVSQGFFTAHGTNTAKIWMTGFSW